MGSALGIYEDTVRARQFERNIDGWGMKKEPDCDYSDWRSRHYCEIPAIYHLYGPAIDDCFEDRQGQLFVSNGEYGCQINFCPMCGYEAKVKVLNED